MLMFELDDVYNMVQAKRFDQEWEDQKSLADAYRIYSDLSATKQAQFDSLVTKALKQCKDDFKCFPEEHRTEQDMELHAETESAIMTKLEKIFNAFI